MWFHPGLSPPTPLCLPLSYETGFKTLYLLSRQLMEGVVCGDGKSATPLFSNVKF